MAILWPRVSPPMEGRGFKLAVQPFRSPSRGYQPQGRGDLNGMEYYITTKTKVLTPKHAWRSTIICLARLTKASRAPTITSRQTVPASSAVARCCETTSTTCFSILSSQGWSQVARGDLSDLLLLGKSKQSPCRQSPAHREFWNAAWHSSSAIGPST